MICFYMENKILISTVWEKRIQLLACGESFE